MSSLQLLAGAISQLSCIETAQYAKQIRIGHTYRRILRAYLPLIVALYLENRLLLSDVVAVNRISRAWFYTLESYVHLPSDNHSPPSTHPHHRRHHHHNHPYPSIPVLYLYFSYFHLPNLLSSLINSPSLSLLIPDFQPRNLSVSCFFTS